MSHSAFVPWRFLLGAVLTATLLSPGLVAAQDKLPAGSLAFVPADAHVYSSSLRLKEQWDVVVQSKAWAKLWNMPIVKKGWAQVLEEWNEGKLAMAKAFYEMPENRELVELLKQMVADEVFFFSGGDSTQFALLFQEIYNANQLAPLGMLLKGDFQAANDPQARIRSILQTLDKKGNRIKAPDLVIGYKIADTKIAKNQLKRLEDLAQAFPPLQDILKKNKIGTGEYLTLTVNGSMVPWEQFGLRNYEEKEGEFDNLLKTLKALKLTVSLGLREDYLILALGETTAPLASLGKGPLLKDRDEMKPLAKFADKRISQVGYLSKECRLVFSTSKKDLEASIMWLADAAKDSGLLTDQQIAKLRKDLKGIAEDLGRNWPVPGASMGFAFLNGRGSESYSYDWSTNPMADASKPLTLLDHLGGNPLFYFCSRVKYDPKDYQSFAKMVKLAIDYFEEIGLPKLPDQARQEYEKIMKVSRPILTRINKTTGTMLVPALADGQSAFIFDAKLASKQWHQMMPASEKALPFPELALALGVKDPALLRKAFEEYRNIFNDLIIDLGGIYPQIPPIQIPPPDTKMVKGGTLYYYPIPDILGLDAKIGPAAGLGEKVAVVTLSQDHASRLLDSTPIKSSPALQAKLKGNLSSAVYFDWAGFVDAATPWVEYGFQRGNAPEDMAEMTRTALQIAQVLRSFSGVSYIEDGVQITHGEVVIQDLK